MALAAIEQLLKNKIGIDFEVVGNDSLHHFVRRRMGDLGVINNQAYLELIEKSEFELQALINLITIPETWFFRDNEPFNYLKDYIKEGWIDCNENDHLSILSLPCSTGEEPYSIAMVLNDLGMPRHRFTIDAFDINDASLLKAKNAIYRENSFRGSDLSFRLRHFTKVGDDYRLKKSIVESVNFYRGNALDISEQASGRLYNVIFCRNLLIYYDKATQLLLLNQLQQLLMKNGRIFLGHAETTELVMGMFDSVGGKGTFSYKTKSVELKPLSVLVSPNAMLPGSVQAKRDVTSHEAMLIAKSNTRTNKPRSIKPVDNSLIRDIERKANNGDLVEAERLCMLLVEQGTEDANELCLCGVINEARGEFVRAGTLFQRAIEINPQHYEATVHLAENLESQGMTDKATLLRQRAKEIAIKNESS